MARWQYWVLWSLCSLACSCHVIFLFMLKFTSFPFYILLLLSCPLSQFLFMLLKPKCQVLTALSDLRVYSWSGRVELSISVLTFILWLLFLFFSRMLHFQPNFRWWEEINQLKTDYFFSRSPVLWLHYTDTDWVCHYCGSRAGNEFTAAFLHNVYNEKTISAFFLYSAAMWSTWSLGNNCIHIFQTDHLQKCFFSIWTY